MFMRILMLVNWKIEYMDSIPEDKQSPDYLVPGVPYWFFKYFKNQDIEVDVEDVHTCSAIENFEKNKLRFYILQTLRVLPKLKKYDMVVSHGMQSGIVLCLLRRIFGKGKYKHVVFDIGAFNSARESGRALKLMQFASKSLDGVIYHTESQIDYYKKCHPWLLDKANFVSYGADAEYFEEICDDEQPDEEEYILCAGYHQRDWNTLIKAYKNSMQKYKLMLVGNSKLDVDDPMIIIKPAVSTAEFKKMIANAKFCVLPLEYHNYSYGQMTLLQQMAMGKAVIVADVPSIQSYKKSKAFLTYEPENESDLGVAINRLFINEELTNTLGKEASLAVKTMFNERIMAEEIEKCLLRFQ